MPADLETEPNNVDLEDHRQRRKTMTRKHSLSGTQSQATEPTIRSTAS